MVSLGVFRKAVAERANGVGRLGFERVSAENRGGWWKALGERVNPLLVGWRNACGTVAGISVEMLPERLPDALGGILSSE